MFFLFFEKWWEKLGICSIVIYIFIVIIFWIGGEVGYILFLDRKYICLCFSNLVINMVMLIKNVNCYFVWF